MKYLLKIIAAIIIIIIGKYCVSDGLRPEFISSGIIIIVTLIVVEAGYDIYNDWNRLFLVLKCKHLGFKQQYIRFSMSYQYRIKINDKYLLVKNSNFNHYQLVGGKYKRNKYTDQILKSLNAKDDLKLSTNGLMKDDLAVFIPAENAIKFIDWFRTKKDREVSHWREFYEELIDVKGKLLPHNIFPYVSYNFACSVITPLKRTPGWNCWEILQYDVLDLIPTSQQKIELEKLYNQGNTNYVKWADAELINCLGHDNRKQKKLYEIGHHTKWVIQEKWSKE